MSSIKLFSPMNFLKAASMLTGFIPLIMFVGKLIMRSRYRFQTSFDMSGSVSSAPKPKIKASHLPSKQERVRERAESFASYKRAALEKMEAKTVELRNPDFKLSREQQESLEEAVENMFRPSLPEGLRIVRGGQSTVLFLDSIPGFVFKANLGNLGKRDELDRYVEMNERARDLIHDESLFLLDAPASQVIEVNGRFLIMQERSAIEHGDFKFQKGLHQALSQDDELKPFMKEMYRQLAQFIARFGFADVKYDNIPISKDGVINLIDLDQSRAMAGLFSGCAGQKDGLFHSIPSAWMQEIKEDVQDLIPEEDQDEFERLFTDARRETEESEEESKAFEAYLTANNVKSGSQTLNPKAADSLEDRIHQVYAKVLIEILNTELEKDRSYAPQLGRCVNFSVNVHSEAAERAEQVVLDNGKEWSYLLKQENKVSFSKELLPDTLEELKRIGAIFDYQLNESYHYVKVRC